MRDIEALWVQEVNASSFLHQHDAFDIILAGDNLKVDESNAILNEDGFQVLLDIQR